MAGVAKIQTLKFFLYQLSQEETSESQYRNIRNTVRHYYFIWLFKRDLMISIKLNKLPYM